jgi:hypothetical protein
VLAGERLRLAHHEALVTTPEGDAGVVVWDVLALALVLVLVPAPRAGSWPCAICTASPPKIAPAAATDTAITRMLAVRVDSRGLMPTASPLRLNVALEER